MGRRSLLAIGAAIGTLLGIGLYDRFLRPTARVDLYYDDGSMISLDGSAAEAAIVLPHAHEALRAAR
jgi:hypothetical protein